MIDIADFLRLRVGAGQFLDLEILEMTHRSFGLHGEIALARTALADAGDLLAVDFELEHAVVGYHLVVIPLPAALGAILVGQAALPAVGMRAVGLAACAPDAEQVAVASGGDF